MTMLALVVGFRLTLTAKRLVTDEFRQLKAYEFVVPGAFHMLLVRWRRFERPRAGWGAVLFCFLGGRFVWWGFVFSCVFWYLS